MMIQIVAIRCVSMLIVARASNYPGPWLQSGFNLEPVLILEIQTVSCPRPNLDWFSFPIFDLGSDRATKGVTVPNWSSKIDHEGRDWEHWKSLEFWQLRNHLWCASSHLCLRWNQWQGVLETWCCGSKKAWASSRLDFDIRNPWFHSGSLLKI